MSPGRRGRPPAGLVFALTLGCALLAAAVQGWVYYADRMPSPAVSARLGEPVRLGGAEFEVTSFTVAAELPAEDPEQNGSPTVRGPAGSALVLIVYRQQVDASVVLDRHFCAASLVADDGTVWEEDDELGYGLRRPEATTCGDSDDDPLRVGAVREIGASYLIPERYADQVRWRLSLADQGAAVEFRR